MPPYEVPGYYYDEVKNKYFKIQENHLAPPGSNHSREAIKRGTQLALARKREQDRDQLEREQTIQRSKLLQHSLLGRELGSRKDGTGMRWDVWAKELQRKESSQVEVEVDGPYEISRFIFDELTGGLIIASNWRLITGIPVPNSDSGKNEYKFNLAAYIGGEIFSISLSPSRVLMTVLSDGLAEGKVQIDRLVSPQTLFPYTRRRPSPELRETVPQLTHDGSIQFRIPRLSSIWGSSARPHSTRSDFALAASGGTTLVVESQTGWDYGRHQLFANANGDDEATDVLAVDWQSVNVVLSGCRDRTVRLWDVRVGEPHGTSLRLRHSSTINHVRKLNDNSIIVAGMERQLCTYDLRFLPEIDTSYGPPPNRPFTTFPEYKTHENQMFSVGFDVSEDVVAAGVAEDGEHHGVQLFDAKSGRKMCASIRNKYPGGAPPRCVKLVGGSHSWPAPSLMYSSSNGINRWR